MQDLTKKLKLLGLNDTQCKTYLFILKQEHVNLKSVADLMNMSSTGAKKMLDELIDKGFIKKFEIGVKKLYMANDLNVLEEKLLSKKEEELDKMKSTLKELKDSYGDYTIRVERIPSENLVNKTKELIVGIDDYQEFIDMTDIIQPNKEKPTGFNNINVHLVYNSPDRNFEYKGGKRIELDNNKKYARVICMKDKVLITTTNKESLLLDNQEFYNSIKFMIEFMYNSKTTD